MLVAAAALAFDMTAVLALMYPGRERVEMVGSQGDAYVFACKPGPAGEAPRAQAELAMAAFEENAAKFATVVAGEMLQDIGDDQPTLGIALKLTRKTDSWAGAILTHMERQYGCVLLG